jgi:Cu/Ag efflux protein CusF
MSVSFVYPAPLEGRPVSQLRFRSDPVLATLVAVVLLLVCALPASAADAKGKVKSITANRNEVVMTDDAGKDWTVIAARDCKFRVNDKDAKIEDLQAGDEVTITYEKDGDRLVARNVRATRK